jgi:hypothetical protein
VGLSFPRSSRKRPLIHAEITAGLMSALLACTAGTPDRPAGVPEPPPPLSEFRSEPPVPGMIWVPGAWHWDGATYVWVPGRWESPPPIPEKP